MKIKSCSKCNETELEKFHTGSDNTYCKRCQSEYAKQHYKLNKDVYRETRKRNKPRQITEKRSVIRGLKESNACVDCGEFYPYYVMHFDHLDDKQNEISAMVAQNYSVNAILNEIEKCDLVCSNCHRERTQSRFVEIDVKRKAVLYVQEYKNGKLCVGCAKAFNYYVLDFDHRPGENKIDCIGFMVYYASLDAIKKEIAKCDLLCANCHSIKTHNRTLGNVAE